MPNSDRLVGELLPNGFYVGDVVRYDTAGPGVVGVVTRHTAPTQVWATYAHGGGEEEALRAFNSNGRSTWMATSRTILIRRYNETTEGSTPMTFTFHGEEIEPTATVSSVEAGQEYRVIYTRDFHNFEFIGRARDSVARVPGHSVRFEIVRWVHENGSWSGELYPPGYSWGAAVSSGRGVRELPDCMVLPLAPAESLTLVSSDSNYAGEPGEFLPHNNEMPEPGTVVRGFVTGSSRQVEGLFLRHVDNGTAVIERKRKRNKRANGTFTDWETYANTGRVTVSVEGALVFKAGAVTEPTLVRTTPIVDRDAQRAIMPGDILSAAGAGNRDVVYRGAVVTRETTGEVTILATERARLSDPYSRSDAYTWEPYGPMETMVHCTWSDGREGHAVGGYLWQLSGPGAPKRVDPAFDPNRVTQFTGQKIGDLVVGRRASGGSGRDTVSSWVKGTIIKWDLRHNAPIVKVTDKMESSLKVDDEVMVVAEDVYPALADPAGADPDEFKKTLRAYLIGRHKHGDFCQGGLNTMLAAHGIPLYETRRRAKMVLTVDYDPNTTDLYRVREGLRRAVDGVTGLDLSEQSGEDFEVESDVTAG